ncbi:hypothetical protein Lepto7375DRAFT_8344 [Leptolyngbya sp. PCC 7375]|nr:hypothetical protein Lepto7375DRAFT_8344 [Leptolyngbya sp. PCC 7375]
MSGVEGDAYKNRLMREAMTHQPVFKSLLAGIRDDRFAVEDAIA